MFISQTIQRTLKKTVDQTLQTIHEELKKILEQSAILMDQIDSKVNGFISLTLSFLTTKNNMTKKVKM
ncbi:hypothetical protein H1164_14505 [Thermoactinomyces daqus]|jgi:hypothetical protein|uniref:Uncharacterized protein n=1 Tax=Thermoactinomyces daqus TaxID=1329516 RepID=A0A7W2AJS0_9BACL|nr:MULTISPECIES: hypothetical protein [Thermoactinomyces]MBA4544094.1 hypothetical protein [Thermoactinomyces daqus]MBH8605825.1 hypothetical protein [Thermoactinomyces sp. CICC 10522]